MPWLLLALSVWDLRSPSTRGGRRATGCCSARASSRRGSPSSWRPSTWRSRSCWRACWCGSAPCRPGPAGWVWPWRRRRGWGCSAWSCRAVAPASRSARPWSRSPASRPAPGSPCRGRCSPSPSSARGCAASRTSSSGGRAAGASASTSTCPPRPAPPIGVPPLLQIHGGAWVIGDKREQGLPLMHHLAASGWVCFNANYRLSPRATLPDHLVDCKRALAWIREHADEYGVDPDFVVRHRRLGGRPPHRPRGAHRQRPRVPARVRGRRHLASRRRCPSTASTTSPTATAACTTKSSAMFLEPWVMKASLADEPEKFDRGLADRLRARRRAAVPRHPRRPRHAGARHRRPPVRRAAARACRRSRCSTPSCAARSTPSRSSGRCGRWRASRPAERFLQWAHERHLGTVPAEPATAVPSDLNEPQGSAAPAPATASLGVEN